MCGRMERKRNGHPVGIKGKNDSMSGIPGTRQNPGIKKPQGVQAQKIIAIQTGSLTHGKVLGHVAKNFLKNHTAARGQKKSLAVFPT